MNGEIYNQSHFLAIRQDWHLVETEWHISMGDKHGCEDDMEKSVHSSKLSKNNLGNIALQLDATNSQAMLFWALNHIMFWEQQVGHSQASFVGLVYLIYCISEPLAFSYFPGAHSMRANVNISWTYTCLLWTNPLLPWAHTLLWAHTLHPWAHTSSWTYTSYLARHLVQFSSCPTTWG